MFIIGKIISDGETNFTQHKYNKLQKISAENKSKVQIWDHLQFNLKLPAETYRPDRYSSSKFIIKT